MALSFQAVEKAYEVFAELKQIIPLKIPSYPEDMYNWSQEEKAAPKENIVVGYDHKQDGGWENLFCFIKDPSPELKQKFDELKGKVPNTSISRAYRSNGSLWVFGWF